MTDATDTAADALDGAPATTDPGPDEGARQDAPEAPTGDVAALRREAANYRRRLRAVEAERDALAERVTAFQRAEVERIVVDGDEALTNGADIWAGGVELCDLLDDDGGLDVAKVDRARDRVLSDRPHWRRLPGGAAWDGGARRASPPAPDFAGALRRAARSGQ